MLDPCRSLEIGAPRPGFSQIASNPHDSFYQRFPGGTSLRFGLAPQLGDNTSRNGEEINEIVLSHNRTLVNNAKEAYIHKNSAEYSREEGTESVLNHSRERDTWRDPKTYSEKKSRRKHQFILDDKWRILCRPKLMVPL